jgi:hypothetical protein
MPSRSFHPRSLLVGNFSCRGRPRAGPKARDPVDGGAGASPGGPRP